jgi:hypothetical protein
MKIIASTAKTVRISLDKATWERIGIKAKWLNPKAQVTAPVKTPVKTPTPVKNPTEKPGKQDPFRGPLPRILPKPKAKKRLHQV